MAYLKVKNRAVSALAADITDTATSLSVTAGEGAKFPSAGDFHVTCEDEIGKVTARSIDTLTVARAQEGTTAAAHAAGISVELRITAGVLESRDTWTEGKLKRGAGDGVEPTEIDVPAAATTVYKTADEIVNNSTTLQNDDHLFFAVAANEAWEFRLALLISSSTVADLKFAMVMPADGTVRAFIVYLNAAGTFASGSMIVGTTKDLYGGGTTVISRPMILEGVIINGATAGNFQVQWAQNTAEATDSTVRTNSYIIAHKLA